MVQIKSPGDIFYSRSLPVWLPKKSCSTVVRLGIEKYLTGSIKVRYMLLLFLWSTSHIVKLRISYKLWVRKFCNELTYWRWMVTKVIFVWPPWLDYMSSYWKVSSIHHNHVLVIRRGRSEVGRLMEESGERAATEVSWSLMEAPRDYKLGGAPLPFSGEQQAHSSRDGWHQMKHLGGKSTYRTCWSLSWIFHVTSGRCMKTHASCCELFSCRHLDMGTSWYSQPKLATILKENHLLYPPPRFGPCSGATRGSNIE